MHREGSYSKAGRGSLVMSRCWIWDLPPPSTEPKTLKTRKVSKKSPEKSFGPPGPAPKKSEKGSKSHENSWFSDFFSTFQTFLGLFSGSLSGGPELLSGDFFEAFWVFGGFGLCRWRGRSQRWILSWGGGRFPSFNLGSFWHGYGYLVVGCKCRPRGNGDRSATFPSKLCMLMPNTCLETCRHSCTA